MNLKCCGCEAGQTSLLLALLQNSVKEHSEGEPFTIDCLCCLPCVERKATCETVCFWNTYLFTYQILMDPAPFSFPRNTWRLFGLCSLPQVSRRLLDSGRETG